MRLARHFEMGGVRGERDLRLTHLHRKKSESLFSESSCMFSFVMLFLFWRDQFFESGERENFYMFTGQRFLGFGKISCDSAC